MSNVKFVLHRPRNPKNIGASARGMANFGFRTLTVVEPYSKAWREIRAAVHASDVVKKAKKVKTLKQALRDCHVVIGTSAAQRRALSSKLIDLENFRSLVIRNVNVGHKVALVFGSEKSGLSNQDLSYCQYVVNIPTDKNCPSMNLAQAVAVISYVLNERPSKTPLKLSNPAVTHEAIERLVDHGVKALSSAGFLKRWDLVQRERRLREAFIRWNMTSVDMALLHGLFRWVLKHANSPAQKDNT